MRSLFLSVSMSLSLSLSLSDSGPAYFKNEGIRAQRSLVSSGNHTAREREELELKLEVLSQNLHPVFSPSLIVNAVSEVLII